MNKKKLYQLREKGWKPTTVKELLALSEKEMKEVDRRIKRIVKGEK